MKLHAWLGVGLLILGLTISPCEAGRPAAPLADNDGSSPGEAADSIPTKGKKQASSRTQPQQEAPTEEYQTTQFRVGLWTIFLEGLKKWLNGIDQDPRRLKLKAEEGDAKAQMLVGLLTLSGREGFTQDLAMGMEWFKRCADQNEPWCQTALGLNYLIGRGNGVDLDDDQGSSLIRRAAENGLPTAQFILANMAWKGLPGGRPDEIEALRWFKASAENGDVHGQNQMAKLHYFGDMIPQNPEEAIHWAKKAAEQGDGDSELLLGLIYLNSEKPPGDPALAAQWLKKAVSHGNTAANYHLARLYFYGMGGMTRDPVTAAQWARQGAEKGSAPAQGLLGRMYFLGMGVERDDKEGLRWERRAALQGDFLAMYALAVYPDRDGNIEPEEVYQWTLIALRHPEISSHGDMDDGLKELKKYMERALSKKEKAEGRRRAKDWTPRMESGRDN